MHPNHPTLYTLSIFQEPWAYLWFVVHWVSSLVCVFVSLRFWMKRKGGWWILIAIAFALPLVGDVVDTSAHGLPPLPYGTIYPIQPSEQNATGAESSTFIQTTEVSIRIDTLTPLVAAALAWAFLADRRRTITSS